MGTVRIAHIMCLCVQVATQAVVKVMQEKPACSNSDIESQLLEAAKNGDIDVVKVSCGSSPPLSSPLLPPLLPPLVFTPCFFHPAETVHT